MIICGFPGVGKSYAGKQYDNLTHWIDLESTPFNRNWDMYIDTACYLSQQGYIVMLTSHKELRERLKERGINYTVVLPKDTDDVKDEYIKRYTRRGSSEEFIKNIKNKWSEYTKSYEWERVIRLEKNEYISDEKTREALLDVPEVFLSKKAMCHVFPDQTDIKIVDELFGNIKRCCRYTSVVSDEYFIVSPENNPLFVGYILYVLMK